MYLMQNFQTERLIAAVGACASARLSLDDARRLRTRARTPSASRSSSARSGSTSSSTSTPRSRCPRRFVYKCVDHYNDERYVKKAPLSFETVKLISMAKIAAGDLASEVTDACLQFHGGWGYIEELPDRARLARPAAPPHRRGSVRDHAVLPRETHGLLEATVSARGPVDEGDQSLRVMLRKSCMSVTVAWSP